MKASQFLRELQNQGVQIVNGAKHYKLINSNCITFFPRSGSKEVNRNCARQVLKQLNIESIKL